MCLIAVERSRYMEKYFRDPESFLRFEVAFKGFLRSFLFQNVKIFTKIHQKLKLSDSDSQSIQRIYHFPVMSLHRHYHNNKNCKQCAKYKTKEFLVHSRSRIQSMCVRSEWKSEKKQIIKSTKSSLIKCKLSRM